MKTEVDLAKWRSAVRRDLADLAKEVPQENPIGGAKGADSIVKAPEGFEDASPRGRQGNTRVIIRVSVACDESRLQHPVQQFLESAKVIRNLLVVGWHTLRAQRAALRRKLSS